MKGIYPLSHEPGPPKHEHSPVALSIYISIEKSLKNGIYSLSWVPRELEHSPWDLSMGSCRAPRYAKGKMFARDIDPPNMSILPLLFPYIFLCKRVSGKGPTHFLASLANSSILPLLFP